MKIGLHISLALIVGFSLLAGLRACNPFEYLNQDARFMLKGTVER